MAGWGETARGLVKPISEMADNLKDDLSELSDVEAIHFEELVKVKGPSGNTPKCVDCMAQYKSRMYMIEFKPLPCQGDDVIRESLALKAVESAHIYGRFLKEEFGDLDLGFILVTQDHRQGIVETFRRRAGMDSSGDLARYSKRDEDGNIMFYDMVEMYGCDDFVRIAEKRFRHR